MNMEIEDLYYECLDIECALLLYTDAFLSSERSLSNDVCYRALSLITQHVKELSDKLENCISISEG